MDTLRNHKIETAYTVVTVTNRDACEKCDQTFNAGRILDEFDQLHLVLDPQCEIGEVCPTYCFPEEALGQLGKILSQGKDFLESAGRATSAPEQIPQGEALRNDNV